MSRNLYGAVATMVGYIIGAGMLSIPFTVARSGFVIGMMTIIGLGLCVLFLNLFLGEICLRTKGKHQLTGLAEKYLGQTGKWLMTKVMIFGVYGALVAYILKEGQFLQALFSPLFGGSQLLYSLIFFAIVSYLIFKGLDAIEEGEVIFVSALFLIISILLIISYKSISFENLTAFNPGMFLVPFGAVLFAFNGSGSIPEIVVELRKNKKLIRKAIIIGSIIPIFIYIIFTALVVGVTGADTTDGAILGVAEKVGGYVLISGILLGIIVLATSFMAVGLSFKEMLMFDFRLRPYLASTITCFGALALTLLVIFIGIENAFYKVINITGSIEVPLAAILIILMLRKAKEKGDRKPEFVNKNTAIISIIITAVFLLGFINQILTWF